jgi:2-polyprenyl-6-methoxyphenol hydroxylase-like FAD-dependent oxidoreductase
MTQHAVVIVGAGPTGLMLAAELALARVDVAIVERRLTQDIAGLRAGGLHSRTIEVLDQRGIVDRFLSEGQVAQTGGFAQIKLDLSDFPTRHPYGLGLWQSHFERILAGWVGELAVPIYRGREVTAFAQDDTGVDIELSAGNGLRAEYLVGCDGGRSLIRKAAGIEFPGWDPTTSSLIAAVEMVEKPELGIHRTAFGIHAFGREEYEIRDGKLTFKDVGPIRVMVPEQHPVPAGEPTLRDLSAALIKTCGTDYGAHSPTLISRFTDMTRQAAAYRNGRVLLAGDAAHVHSPVGGQGLNTGVQDAVNLGWKLAQVVKRTSPESLLDTYHAERHPVAARVLRNTMAQVALLRTDDRTEALRAAVSELLSMDEPRKHFAAKMSGLDIRYDLAHHDRDDQALGHHDLAHHNRGDHDRSNPNASDDPNGRSSINRRPNSDRHPLLGRRIPDLDLITAIGPFRLFTLLHKARPVLLNLGEPSRFDITPWADRVDLVEAEYGGVWELPALGTVAPPTAVLIRPDGHVAWVSNQAHPTLRDALTTWFGPPIAPC